MTMKRESPERHAGGGDGGPIGRPKRLGRAAGAGVTTRRRRRASRRAHLSPRAAPPPMTPAPARAWTQPAPHARGHRHEHADVRRRALLCERVGLAPARRESRHVGEAFTSRGRTQRRVASRSSMATTTTTQRCRLHYGLGGGVLGLRANFFFDRNNCKPNKKSRMVS